MDLQLAGKNALVTGSSSGIGEGIARSLALEGARVVINGRDRERAEGVAEAIRSEGGHVAVAVGDVANGEGAVEVAERSLEAFGGIDILVNNVGGRTSSAGVSDWLGAQPQDWIDTYNQNTVAAVRMAQLLVPGMIERGWGRLIQIASASASAPTATLHYTASKAAMVNMTLGLSKALARTGVTSNTVSPGVIKTPALERYFTAISRDKGWGDDPARAEEFMLRESFGQSVDRMGIPSDIGALVAFVASPVADFMSGANLRSDGGFSPAVN